MIENSAFIVVMMLVAFLSAGITALTLWRMLHYIQAYKFDRDKYRPLFGLIPLRVLILFYTMASFLIAGTSIMIFALI